MSASHEELKTTERRSMSLAAISIRNPVFAWMLMIGLILVGGVAVSRLGVSLMPDVDLPTISVTATLEGADPEIMESEVVDVIEDAVMAVSGVKEVTSSARQGSCSVSVEFVPEKDIDVAFQEVQARVSANMRLLPQDVDPPSIAKTNPEDFPILWVTLTGMRPQRELSEYARNVLRDRFLTVPDTGDVMMGGFQERNLRIWIDPLKLQSRELTVDDVIKAVQREHVELPAGRLEGSVRESNVKVEGEALSLDQWNKLRVKELDGAAVYVGDVAVVEDGMADIRRISRVDGTPAQGLGIIKQRGANAVNVADACRERIAELNKTLPNNMELKVRFDQTQFIKEAYEETQFTLILSVLLTALVCWLFLGSISSTFNVILAIPVSVFGTFAVIYFCGFTLNLFTLLALTLSIGLVVDDAIMVLENIYRHAEMGHDRAAASQLGTEQVQFAALCATLALVAIFLPVVFIKGVIGKYFLQFGVVLSVAVMISLLEALTLAPMRCSQFLRVGQRGNVIERAVGYVFESLARAYGRLLDWMLGWGPWRYAVIVASLVIFFGSMLLIRDMPREEVPAQDQGLFMIRFRGPVDWSISRTNEVVQDVEEIVNRRAEIESCFANAGSHSGEANEGMFFINMKPRDQRPLRNGKPITQQQSIDELRKELNVFPGVEVTVVDRSKMGLSGGGRGGGLPVSFSVRGPDWNKLGELSNEFKERMLASQKMVDVSSDYRVGMPEIQVLPNRQKTLAHNVDVQALGETVRALVGGYRIAKFTYQGRRYDVRLRLLRGERLRPEDIGLLFVRNRVGEPVRISELVDLETRPSLQSIFRVNRMRAVTVSANPAPGVPQNEALAEVDRISSEILPEGYEIVLTGSSRSASESFGGLFFGFLAGLVVAYMVLASQFNSYLHPFTILLALPFSLTGALLGLYLGGQSINVFSVIALILLAGIVKKNSILLVDFTNQLRSEGRPVNQALREACPIRLRPILMTSVATIAGAVPGALAVGPGGELRIPMSIAVIGGVIVSTLLTLFVVPCFYSIAEEWREKLACIYRFVKGQRDAETCRTALRALGVLNILFGVLGFVLPALCMVCARNPNLLPWTKTFSAQALGLAGSAGLLMSIVLIIAGISLYAGQAIGRWLSLAWSAFDFLGNAALSCLYASTFVAAWRANKLPSLSVWIWVVLCAVAAMLLLRAFGYPLLLAYVVTRSETAEHLTGNATEGNRA